MSVLRAFGGSGADCFLRGFGSLRVEAFGGFGVLEFLGLSFGFRV